MNEKLLKQLIRLKLDAAGAVIEHMPRLLSNEMQKAGRIILEVMNERMQDMKGNDSGMEKASAELDSIHIE